jgi:hypothetical protein
LKKWIAPQPYAANWPGQTGNGGKAGKIGFRRAAELRPDRAGCGRVVCTCGVANRAAPWKRGKKLAFSLPAD